jgi:hypothetical protein
MNFAAPGANGKKRIGITGAFKNFQTSTTITFCQYLLILIENF